MRTFACVSLAALVAGTVFGQAANTQATFEAADVHLSPHSTNLNPYMRGPFVRAGRFEVRTATMVDLISKAYSVDANTVLGGPSWLEWDRYDVVAKYPSDSTADSRKAMLQALLADRFKLVLHKDTKPMPAYALAVGKRPLLKKTDGSGETGCKFIPPTFPPGGGGPVELLFAYSCHNMTMAAFAEGFRNLNGAFQVVGEDPVVDRTGLTGAWDFDFKFSPRGFGGTTPSEALSFLDAVEKQLGLKLDPVSVPMPVLVVDSASRTPTDNLPGVAESLQLGAIKTEFDVADVQPTSPDFKGVRYQIQPGGRVNLQGVTLKMLIQQAFNVNNDDLLVGAPKWLDNDHWDIVAKATAAISADEPSAGPNSGPQIDFDTVLMMLRNLLIDRFKLTTHFEDRPVSAYTLVALKPKMKKADPNSRTRFKEGPASRDEKDPRNANPILGRLVSVQNMTTAQFAAQLQNIAPGYIHSPVLDSTGLDGSWDFTLSFSPAGAGQGGGRGGRGGDAGAGATPEASEPSGALSLLDAMEKQLGLKLEMQKRPVSVLVIDHIEQKPTEN